MIAIERSAMSLEIPPGNAVLRTDDDGVRREDRAELGSERRETVRFDAKNDDVGRTCRREIARDVRAHLEISIAAPHAESAFAHRLQMRATREQHDVNIRAGKAGTDIAANRSRPGDQYLHDV